MVKKTIAGLSFFLTMLVGFAQQTGSLFDPRSTNLSDSVLITSCLQKLELNEKALLKLETYRVNGLDDQPGEDYIIRYVLANEPEILNDIWLNQSLEIILEQQLKCFYEDCFENPQHYFLADLDSQGMLEIILIDQCDEVECTFYEIYGVNSDSSRRILKHRFVPIQLRTSSEDRTIVEQIYLDATWKFTLDQNGNYVALKGEPEDPRKQSFFTDIGRTLG